MDAGAPETAPGGRPAAALRAPGAGSEAAAQAARARGFTGARGGTWRGSGRGEPCSGTSSIYSRLATHAHARSHTHTHARRGTERAALPAPLPSLPPLLPPRQARPPRFPRAEVSAPRRRHCGATCRRRLARHPPRGRARRASGSSRGELGRGPLPRRSRFPRACAPG